MTTGRLSRERCKGDRGAGVVEFALVLPLLVVLVLGIMDYGFALRESSRLERAASSAARTGASLANYKYTDYEILKQVDSATAGIDGLIVDKVIVYKTTQSNGTVPPNCLTAPTGVSGTCNVYNAAKIANDNVEAGFSGRAFGAATSCVGDWDANWCPMSPPPPAVQSRERRRPNNHYLGVWIQARYQGITDMIPGELTMTKYAVFAIEPCFKGDSNCAGF